MPLTGLGHTGQIERDCGLLFIRVSAEHGAGSIGHKRAWRSVGSLFLSPSLVNTLSIFYPLFLSLHIFVSHCLMPSDGCGNILREMSILFPINPFLHFHAGVCIESTGERKSAAVSKKMSSFSICLPHTFEACHIRVPFLFKFASSILCGRQNLKGHISLMKNPLCVCALMS